jgi:hypothetical protein
MLREINEKDPIEFFLACSHIFEIENEETTRLLAAAIMAVSITNVSYY